MFEQVIFEQLIRECRARIAKSRSALLRRLGITSAAKDLAPRDDIPEQLRPHYLELLGTGAVVWGCIAQANSRLFSPGEDDLPANTVYSPSGHFDGNPQRLRDIAHAVYRLKNTIPEDPELATVAALITDEYNAVEKERLPTRLTGGHEVYLATTIVHRSRLPDGTLSDGLFPLLICPRTTPANMILPLRYWPPPLTERWRRQGAEARHAPDPRRVSESAGTGGKPQSAPPAARPCAAGEATVLVSLTPAAVRKVREIAEIQQVLDRFYLSVGVTKSATGDQHSVELALNWDKDREICIECSGIRVLVDKSHVPLLAGSVVDFRQSIYGSGFVVRKPDPRPVPQGKQPGPPREQSEPGEALADEEKPTSVRVTSAAARAIREIAESERVQDSFFLCVGVTATGNEYKFRADLAVDWDRENELCFESLGIRVLIPKAHAEHLSDLVIDYWESPRRGFVFTRSRN